MNHNKIIHTLCAAGFPSYLVGGAVRDLFDGSEPSDYDIVTQATPDQITEIFKGQCKVSTVGKSFGVTLVGGYEVATFRVDRYPEKNGAKNCVPVFATSIHDDLARRDFTVNAIALCPISGDYIDNFDGLVDLKNRVVRFVGDADERIQEDPNRIIRACRFVAKLHGTFDMDTLFALRKNAHLVGTHIEPERIAGEVKKAMTLPVPSLFFSALHVIGALDLVFPGLSACVDHDHGKFHKETVWDHLMIAGDSVNPRFPLVRLATFFHDVGKPKAFANQGDGSFIDHENIGTHIVDGWLNRLRFSTAERHFVTGLVASHMWGGGSEKLSPKAVRRLRKRLADLNVDIKDWLRVRIADRNANFNKQKFSLHQIRQRRVIFIELEQNLPLTVNSLALKGGELIEVFGLTPGKIVGQLQKHLLEYVLEEGSEVNTVEALKAEAQRFLNR
jgi:tRNA nucleotidyltransferase (CCA-adding enzyme)